MVQQDTRVAVESSLERSMRYFAGIVDTGIVDTIGCWMDTGIVDTIGCWMDMSSSDTIGCWMDMSSSDKNSKAVVAL